MTEPDSPDVSKETSISFTVLERLWEVIATLGVGVGAFVAIRAVAENKIMTEFAPGLIMISASIAGLIALALERAARSSRINSKNVSSSQDKPPQ